jgi:hypothetical protein
VKTKYEIKNRTLAVIFIIIIAALSIIFVPGLIQKEEPLQAIMVDGQTYVFDQDIRKSLKVPMYDEDKILEILSFPPKINILVDTSNTTENAYYAKVSFNTISKLSRYYTHNNVYMEYPFYAMENNTIFFWNRRNNTLTPLNGSIEGPVIMFKGPSLANETSVRLTNQTIVVQGTTQENLSMASEKLVLSLLGVSEKAIEE